MLTNSTRSKNIVICGDGTGNSSSGVPSNVLRLFDWIEQQSPAQVASYDPGVGTLPLPEGRTALGRAIRRARELGFGDGVLPNVVSLYRFLMEHYEHGDAIYLFGFSRGAFTVRALAGMLHVCGLLHRRDVHLVPFAAGLYQTSEGRIVRARAAQNRPPKFGEGETADHASVDDEARDFKARFGRTCRIRFMGLWDTVKAYGWLWPRSFPALRHNPGVESVRHAVALDERRALFKVTGWGDRHEAIKEVWFAGDHSDVGGGHRSGNSDLSDATLRWMLGEATGAGLRLDSAMRHLIGRWGDDLPQTPAAAPHDLSRQSNFWLLDRGPRTELENAVYPPDRNLKLFSPDGARRPGDHDEKSRVVLFHRTVWERSLRMPEYAGPQEWAARATRPLSPPSRAEPEDDRPIVWHD